MRKFLLPIFLFIAFLSESLFVELIPTESFGIDRIFVPRFMMVIIMLISFFYDRNRAVLYAIVFGLMFDIIYTDIIGIYMFSFPVITYIISYSMKVLHTNLFVVFVISLIGLSLLELLVYGLYYLVNVAQLGWHEFIYNRLFPTLILNGVFIIMIYYPFRRFLIGLERLSTKESNNLI